MTVKEALNEVCKKQPRGFFSVDLSEVKSLLNVENCVIESELNKISGVSVENYFSKKIIRVESGYTF